VASSERREEGTEPSRSPAAEEDGLRPLWKIRQGSNRREPRVWNQIVGGEGIGEEGCDGELRGW
jgi:hypothetical protein